VAGALCIAFSSPLVAPSQTSAGTASLFRCLLALPVLAVLALAERHHARHSGKDLTRSGRDQFIAVAAGALLGGDLLLWSQAIGEVGAGVSTVVVNAQVLLVPLIAWLIDREPPSSRIALAIVPMLVGVALAAGVGSQAFGSHPVLGTAHAALAAVFYAGYLFLLRRCAGTGQLVGPMLDATIGAAVVSLLVGSLWHGVDLTPDLRALGWLLALALSGQVAGWLLIAVALPKLPSQVGSALLLLQPVGAVLLGLVLLAQRPTSVQLAGCFLVLAAVAVTTLRAKAAAPTRSPHRS
jgi:drug/metabolite transporter (DMT)-like permease